MEILVLILLILLVVYICFSNHKRKLNILNRISNEFGKKPKDFHEEFDMNFVRTYYKARKENENVNESIDELTWNDLDMDTVFKRTNYTSTTFGETYLYYKFREVAYDSKKWAITEELINSLMKNDSLRNSIKLELSKVGKINDERFINFVYNPDFNKIKGYYKYPLLYKYIFHLYHKHILDLQLSKMVCHPLCLALKPS